MAAAGAPIPLAWTWEGERDLGVSALLDGSGFVKLSAGEFEMGSTNGNPDEQPVHKVRITRAFEIGKYEVTQEQWDVVMRDPHSRGVPVRPSHFRGEGFPVEKVSFDDVQDFLRRLNLRDDKHNYRLPTEAEWEYACGRSAADIHQIAWYEANAEKTTHPVGSKQPNARGIYDMFGNVAEWVQDWYGREYYTDSPLTDPQGPETGSYRVYRGGCWFDPAKNCRVSYRGFDFPNSELYNVGFRLVRVAR